MLDKNYNKIVMKFGGTSMADIDKISKVADHIEREYNNSKKVAVVVSAMSGETDRLINLVDAIGKIDNSERDAVISSGEQVSSALLALTLKARGIQARSVQGWQIPLKTDEVHGSARILDVQSKYLDDLISRKEIPIIAGFQGITDDNRISTLGRGGSDTTAVAIACSLKADLCDIYLSLIHI